MWNKNKTGAMQKKASYNHRKLRQRRSKMVDNCDLILE